MLPIQFVYTEHGQEKSSLKEHQRRVQITEHNQRLAKEYPVYTNSKKKEESP